ncbi:amidohydrolase family protein [Congregibacter sp.]|uniref:amidohydrolase family protein n=1 Tax=Congregibacter sp. TaxID=2744308 RepID=UPI0039E5D42E
MPNALGANFYRDAHILVFSLTDGNERLVTDGSRRGRAATSNGARALGVEDRLTSIEKGTLTDLFVVRANRLDDIKTARNIRLVIRDGVDYNPEELSRSAIGPLRQTPWLALLMTPSGLYLWLRVA